MLEKAVRGFLPVALMGAIIYYCGPTELWRVFQQIDLFQLALLFLVSFILIWISCVKWRLFLRASGSDAALSRLMELYVLGYFVNLFSPSTLGGDAVRSYKLGKDLGNQADSFSATFLERFTGLVAMAVLALIFVGREELKGFEWAVYIFAGAIFFLSAIIFSNIGFDLFQTSMVAISRLILSDKYIVKLEALLIKIKKAASYAHGNNSLILKALVLSFIFHFVAVINTKVAANALGWWDASFAGLFVVVPLVLIISAIPLTPSGIGIQEGAFTFLLHRLGATREQALGVALLLRAKTIVLGIIGGMIWLALEKRGEKTKENAKADQK